VYQALLAQQNPRRPITLKPRTAAIAAAILLLAAGGALAVRERIRAARILWVEKEAAPRIAQLIGKNRRLEALPLYQRAISYAPASPLLPAFAEAVAARPVTFESTPSGAKVYISDYAAAPDEWRLLGTTPLQAAQLPMWGYYRLRVEKEGFAPLLRTFFPPAGLSVKMTLHAASTVPPGMVWVPAGFAISPVDGMSLPGFWMDAYEVSNREYKKFVDAGAYQKPEFWKHPFLKDGKPISWQQAMEEFRDSTGKPGPASWQLGTYPDGAAAMPVGGVSWYEAAAYAEFANKSLPSIQEWFYASGWGSPNSDILAMSNFRGKGPAETGTHRGMAAFGTYDMAGNVSEWVLNATNRGSRYLLGGAWDQEPYIFREPAWAEPLARSLTAGFRCVQRTSPPRPEWLLPVPIYRAPPKRDKPVDDATYKIFSRLQAYDRMHLDAKVEAVDNSSPYWRRETVTFPAAYGGERMMLHLFLPKNAAPPYQVVAVFGGSNVLYTTHVQDFQFPYEFLLRAGRAVVLPVFSGTLERGPSPAKMAPKQQVEMLLRWPKDMGQTIDYLETRRDIDAKKLGFYGLSMGATHGVRLLALDSRLRAAVLVSGGLNAGQPAETDIWNYAPRVRTPVLMLSGRDDMVYPVETAQMPLFNALGTPAQNKRYVQFEGGHANLVSHPHLLGLILEWFDHYLGPVQARP